MATKDIADAAKPIRDVWENITNEYIQHNPGKYLSLTSVYRPPEEQFSLYQKGRKKDSNGNWVVSDKSQVVTNVDGHKTKGAHNYYPSRAIDVAVFDNQTGKASWKEKDYLVLGAISKRFGLVWGGDWDGDGDRTDQQLHDLPHIEVKDYKNYKGA